MYKIVLYTDASDYAHGAYLFQVVLATAKTEEHDLQSTGLWEDSMTSLVT